MSPCALLRAALCVVVLTRSAAMRRGESKQQPQQIPAQLPSEPATGTGRLELSAHDPHGGASHGADAHAAPAAPAGPSAPGMPAMPDSAEEFQEAVVEHATEKGGHGAHGHGDGHGDGHGGHGDGGHGDGHAVAEEEYHTEYRDDGFAKARNHHHGSYHRGEGAHSVAVGLVATVVIVPLVMFMAMSNSQVSTLTFKMLDTFVSIFLAVLWFNTFAQFLTTFRVMQALPKIAPFLSLLQCLGLYYLALRVAWAWRDDHLHMTTFCHVGAHFIAFAGIFAATQSQMELSRLPPPDLQPLASFAFCIYIVLLMGGIAAVTWFVWRRNLKDEEELNHAIDHLELDIIGLVLSFAITQAVRHAIVGKYPTAHHFLQIDSHSFFRTDVGLNERWHVWVMFGWATSLVLIASYILPHLSNQAPDTIWAERLIHITKVILIMLIAWGYLLWGEWEFYETIFVGDKMFGHMVFSCIATLVCLAVLALMAKLNGKLKSPQAIETQDIAIAGISLVAAWSWEHCFNVAIDVIGHEYEVGLEGLVPKLVLSVIIPAFLLPVYVMHIRTQVLQIDHKNRMAHSSSDGHLHAGHELSAEEEAHDVPEGRRNSIWQDAGSGTDGLESGDAGPSNGVMAR